MSQDRIRILKLLVYEGPRDVVEYHVSRTLFGTKYQTYNGKGLIEGKQINGEYSITGYSLVAFPEIIIPQEEIAQEDDIPFGGKSALDD